MPYTFPRKQWQVIRGDLPFEVCSGLAGLFQLSKEASLYPVSGPDPLSAGALGPPMECLTLAEEDDDH